LSSHILRRNCLLKHVIKTKLNGRIEVRERQGKRRKKLLDDLKFKRGYWQFKGKALDRRLWRPRVLRSYGSVARMNE
jgi:hypothetical protein